VARKLTARETEILRAIYDGESCKQCASRMGISEQTVRKHRRKLLFKFSAPNAAALCRLAYETGMVSAARHSFRTVSLPVHSWSRRELEVAFNVARGLSSKHIARELGISPATVRKHRENIFRRIGVHSAQQLTVWWIDIGQFLHAQIDTPSEVQRNVIA